MIWPPRKTWLCVLLSALAVALLTGGTVLAARARRPVARAVEPPAAPAPAPVALVASERPIAPAPGITVSRHTTAPAAIPVEMSRDQQDLLAGRKPMRIMAMARKSMFAWKGDAEVRIRNAADGALIYAAPAGEVVGIAKGTDGANAVLRKNFATFYTLAGPVRLESAKPINLWTPDTDVWMALDSVVLRMNADGTFGAVREMPLEEYLRNVLPCEMPTSFHPAALRAQAIIARTYTLRRLGKHGDEGADMCPSVHCQAYGGDDRRAATTDQAVRDTARVVMLYRGKLADATYHSNCGGVGDDPQYVWGGASVPYLTRYQDLKTPLVGENFAIGDVLGATDSYCGRDPKYRWTRSFTAEQVNALVRKNLAAVTGGPARITTVSNMLVEERSPSGRVTELRVEGDGASVLVHGDKARWLFGVGGPSLEGLPSTLFDLTITCDPHGAISGYSLRGGGFGHGCGLCQWGADGRARAGQDARTILQAYYPGTYLSGD